MIIRDMFESDIERKINGVIQVDQSTDDVIEQELNEYVITKELKKHFISFFNYYSDAFEERTNDMGVWISGFFGSGKSHFLKMLSYILENREVNGIRTVERFRKKFEDDPATFMLIDKSTKVPTETILFNIDIEGLINKDKTAVLRVFAKMFYNHLGYYGENLKVALLERYIDKSGKTEEFRKVFEEKKGKSWEEMRKAFAFNGKHIIPTLMEVLDMSEEDAKNWFNDKSHVEFSIAQLVSDIKEYVSTKPKDFRLIFMVDEVGQYVGTDTDMLLNLQSIVEKIGSECQGQVWVACTGQEAIDEIIKVRADEFSRIQARFKVRLSLSSSSVDEVIQKRILKKKTTVIPTLEKIYNENDSVLRNLFSFTDSVLDIKGYSGSTDFCENFPFVPYQFIIMQKIFTEIRKHGNAGKHFSGGERSMLSGFQEAAKDVKDKDEYALVPLFHFYDTVHTFLDGAIRRVIERCQKAADSGDGIEAQDVNVLKLLYLIRYVDDIKANLDNIVILMADDIRIDKVTMRENVRNSLDRLFSQNYIGRTGDTYNFLTDEEQDIQKDINNTVVDTSSIVERIAHIIFGDIYTSKKFRYDNTYDFAFDQMVDGISVGVLTGGMRLRFLSVATEPSEKSDLHLMASSSGEAIVVLADTPYYETIERELKIRKYVKQRNVNQLPDSIKAIIKTQLDEADNCSRIAEESIISAIENGIFYVDGEKLAVTGDCKSKIEQALKYLVSNVYSELNLITKNVENETGLVEILRGADSDGIWEGMEYNRDAAAKMEEYLEMQATMNLPTSMADIQSRYKARPYGWREIDIAAVAAHLIYEQKVTIKYAGSTIQPNNPKLPEMLHKKSEIAKTIISKRVIVSVQKIKQVKEILREYFDIMDVPNDEDGIIAFIVDKFTELKGHYESLSSRYTGKNYPDHNLVAHALTLTNDVLSQQKDNVALVDYILKRENDLFDSKEDMADVEGFFKTQVTLFDEATKFEADLRHDLDYISKDETANSALNKIRLVVLANRTTKFDYKKIPELSSLMQTVKTSHDTLLANKRLELLEIVRQCMEEIHSMVNGDVTIKNLSSMADTFFGQKKERISELQSLALLDALIPQMWTYKDDVVGKMETLSKPAPEPVDTNEPSKPVQKKIIKAVHRQAIFPARTLESDAEIDEYLDKVKNNLKQLLRGSDGIRLN